MSKLNSRKFYLTVFSLIIVAIGLFTNFLPADNFVSALTLILGLYFAGNVANKFVDKGNNKE